MQKAAKMFEKKTNQNARKDCLPPLKKQHQA